MNAIEVLALTKKFGDFTAVDGISFSVAEGEIFGFLGPNGAGKSTSAYMLTTILKPTSGTAKINGFDISHDPEKVRKSIGIVFQDQTLDSRLSAYDNLDIHGRLYDMPAPDRKKKIREVLGLVELLEWEKKLVKTFSGGMRRRLEIARGLLHTPKIIFLDEPTLGLDAHTRRHIWTYIQKLKQQGITIVLSTHYLEEADALCDRIAIIDHGKIIALDTPSNLKKMLGGQVLSLKSADNRKILELVNKKKLGANARVIADAVSFEVKNGSEAIPGIASAMEKAGIKLESIELHVPSLEDVFIQLTGKQIREEGNGQSDFKRRLVMHGH
ncbi:MAG: ATP-binding cassette domain-containing protein [Candidatus ainarchaeum sp.]|nr:ATP-binding cassette domain-containing protein [Candidatus ainarchaeum sp.]